jgi:hypothetical protein
MPTIKEIYSVLAGETAPLHRSNLAEKLGESSYRSFQPQLDRGVKHGHLIISGDHEYRITESGLKKLNEEAEPEAAEGTDEEKLGTTEYQRFISLGKQTGVSPPELIKQTTDHVWAGGDFTDLDWVARAFQEMGIRQDLRNRWWHSWRSSLKQPIPSQLPSAIVEGEISSATKDAAKKEGKGGRSYILDAEDKPVYVGEGLGDMFYDDALDLSKIRAGRGSKMVTAASPGSMADDLVKMFAAFKEIMGEKAQGKSWVMRQGEDGNVQIEEAEPGKPMVINYPQGNKPQPTVLVTADGEVQEIQPGQPIIIKQPAQQPPGGDQYLVDKQTGQVTKVQPGQPIIIQTASPQPQYPYTPIQMTDKNGNPMVLDLSTYIKLEEHRDKQRREDESHEAKIEITKGFKDLLDKAGRALLHVAKEEGK